MATAKKKSTGKSRPKKSGKSSALPWVIVALLLGLAAYLGFQQAPKKDAPSISRRVHEITRQNPDAEVFEIEAPESTQKKSP